MNARKPTESDIAHCAYNLYLERGCQPGHELDDWLKAEHILMSQTNAIPAPPNKKSVRSVATETRNGIPPQKQHSEPVQKRPQHIIQSR